METFLLFVKFLLETTQGVAALGYTHRRGGLWKKDHMIPVERIGNLQRNRNAITIHMKRPITRSNPRLRSYRSRSRSIAMSNWKLPKIGSGTTKKKVPMSTITLEFSTDQEAAVMHRVRLSVKGSRGMFSSAS